MSKKSGGGRRIIEIFLIVSLLMTIFPFAASAATLTINKTNISYNNIYYVSPNGSDTTGDGSAAKPFASVSKAINKAQNGDLIYIESGNYNLSPMTVTGTGTSGESMGSYSQSGISDQGKSLTIVGQDPANTVLIFYGSSSTLRDGTAFNLYNANSKVIGLTYVFYPGKNANYSNAMFEWCNGQFYNLFIRVSGNQEGAFSYYNQNPSQTPKIYNCAFYFDLGKIYSSYSGSPYFINCISNVDFNVGMTQTCAVESFNPDNIVSLAADTNLINKGTGTNPDGTQANIGVYGGQYSWPLSAPTGLTVSNITSTGAVASWNPVSGASSYNVYINGSPAYNTTQTSYQMTGLSPGTNYTVQVAAVMSGAQSGLATVSFTTLPPPATPSTLTATATACNQVQLSWQPNTESNLAGYIIYRNYVEIARVGATATSYTDTGVQPNTQYIYGIEAYDTSGITSGMSNAATVTTPLPPTPTGLAVSSVTSTGAVASWNPVSGASSYNVYINGSPAYNTTQTSYQMTGLSPGTNYTVQVATVISGVQSDLATVSFTTNTGPPPPATPSNLMVTGVAYNQVQLGWEPNTESDLAGYIIYRNYVEIARVGATATSYTDTGVQPNTQYIYGIRAYNTSGITSGMSNAATVTTPASPYPVLTARVDNHNISLSWTGMADNFLIMVNDQQVASTTGNQYTYTAQPGTYKLQVVAVISGNQYPSDPVSVTVSQFSTPGATTMTGDLLKNSGLVMLPLGGIIALALALKGSPMLIAAVKSGMLSRFLRRW